jgi:hypothetical protein
MIDSLLDQLARQRGIGDAYHNYRGDRVTISRETKSALLAAMGCPVNDATAIERALQEGEAARWRSLLPPVAVVFPGRRSARRYAELARGGRRRRGTARRDSSGRFARSRTR